MGSTGLSTLLRGALGAAGALVFLLGLALIAGGEPAGGTWFLVPGIVLILVALYEQARYHSVAGRPSGASGTAAPAGPPAGGFQRTDEVFDDPTTGERMRVWFDPSTGERRYVAEL